MQIETFEKLKEICLNENKQIYEAVQINESKMLDITVVEFRNSVQKNLSSMKEAIKNGIQNTTPTNGKMGGFDCHKQLEFYKNNPSLFGKLFEKIMCYSLATSEENARMGKIAACPTAGACGIVPGVLISAFEEFNIDIEKQINSLIVAGAIGQIISYKVNPAGAIAGCQAECGTASAMASGALTYILDGSIEEIFNACALSLKNVLGLTCDPVRGFVEVPCIKRNPFLAFHAVVAVEMARAKITSIIPLDEVVDAMEQTGALMAPSLKESSMAGLAKTKTAIMMEKACFTKKYYSSFKD